MNTEEEYLNAINEILTNHRPTGLDYVIDDAHWWTDVQRQAMVLTNDSEQYAIFFRYIGEIKDLHFWVRHLSCKNWVGKEMLEELVSVWERWRSGGLVPSPKMDDVLPPREDAMLASEVLATWLGNGVTATALNHDPLPFNLKYKDYKTNTTPELMAVSEAAERDNKAFTPPETCGSCKHTGKHSHADWTYGHRPSWWVCAQCKSVWACSCRTPDDDGNCDHCGRKMSQEAVDAYREEEAKRWALSQSLMVVNDGSIELELNEYRTINEL